VADTPQYLTLKHNRDAPARVELAARRIVFSLLVVLAALGLANVFGQEEVASAVAGEAARLTVDAPEALRGGLYYQARFTIEALRDVEAATLVFDPGWTEQMQMNTIEPSPVNESSRDGRLAFDFGHLAPGDRLVVYLQYQVNPAHFGRASQGVELHDGETLIGRIDRTLTVFP
jgi:hypothetical protein